METEASGLDGNQPQATADGTNDQEEAAAKAEDVEFKDLMDKTESLINTIAVNHENPNPKALHALSTILETQEARYMEDTGHSSINNARSSHNIGRLGNLIRENEEFFELIASKFLTESGYSVSVQAATVRLLLCCSLTWTYPHLFEDDVLDNIRGWVIDETPKTSAGDSLNSKHDTKSREASDSEMLLAYSTGLLAVCLACGGQGQLVEDVLASGLSAKLMRYLRLRVLGETSSSLSSQRDTVPLNEGKNASTVACSRARDENRGKIWQGAESSPLASNVSRIHCNERGLALVGEAEREPHDDMPFEVDAYEADDEERLNIREIRESRTKPGGKPHREEELDDNREDSAGGKLIRTIPRARGKGRSNSEGAYENDQALTSPGSGSRSGQGRSGGDRNVARNQGLRTSDAKKGRDKNNASSYSLERDDNDDCFQGCKVGSKDFTDLVKKAVRAAEAEARAANAPVGAIKAAGDDAAEVVKNAALEEYKRTNDEEAALLAASRAAGTVVDAADAVVLASSTTGNGDLEDSNPAKLGSNEDFGEYFILDSDALAKLREKFAIQCLVILGEYVEVLGPVLHEKGVDVCLALLHRSIKNTEVSSTVLLLPDILKLICALAAHRKFAAVFVDRGGMQKLLSAPRNAQTFLGLSSCLFTIGSIQGIMERVCALPSNVVHQVVELALQLLQCPQDQARKNAALFFAAAFVFRAVIETFDAQEGLHKLLNVLHDAASVRSGVPPGPLSNAVSLRSDISPAEVLTSSEKQIAYHNCVALRQYFRAHLLLLVDSIRPSKNTRPAPRNTSSARAAYKPLDISNEAIDSVFRQIQKDRKLGPAVARSRWPVVDKFLNSNGHTTMLELCQAPPVERYLHDLLQYALGLLHIVTLVPYSRKPIVNATLSNDRVGVVVILDAVNGAGHVEPEIVEPALNLLINLVCPPPSISNKPSAIVHGQQASSMQNADSIPGQNEPRHRIGEPASVDRGCSSAAPTSSVQASGLVGDRRISLGTGAGCAGLAAQLEQGYRQAREAVRSNNGIKILLQLLQPRMVTSPAALDCIRALACRVLLGLARDDAIAHILTKLQVGKKLSELISGSQTSGSQPNRWQAELTQVAIELIGVVTNSGRASTLAASDAATPTLRRIERAAIAAATPITYHTRELLLLIHEHLQSSGLTVAASALLNEAKLTPLPSVAAPSSIGHQVFAEEPPQIQIQWPSGRVPNGFMSDKSKISQHQDSSFRSDSALKKKPPLSSATRGHSKVPPRLPDSPATAQSTRKPNIILQRNSTASDAAETPSASASKSISDVDTQFRTPIVVPLKRKLTDLKESPLISSAKRPKFGDSSIKSPSFTSPNIVGRSCQHSDVNNLFSPPVSGLKDHNATDENQCCATPMTHGLASDAQPPTTERINLDTIVVQYLKHQHRQCPAPITTLPPLSLFQPHVCPEPKRTLDAPSNVTGRLSTRQYRSMYGGIHGYRKDRQFVYSRFRPWRTCRDDNSSLLTCIAFTGNLSRVAVGGHSGELKVFDCESNNVLESCTSHESSLTTLQSHVFDDTQLLLSSSASEVRLWDGSSISVGPKYSFEGIKSARFSNSGSAFAALRPDSSQREILLYDVSTCQLDTTLTDTNAVSSRGQYSLVHFCPLDIMLLYDGMLWDRRDSRPVHRFELYTNFGGGGFHPAGNEVIINSEVWDLRKFQLITNVPSLDQTVITFNASGDVIYAILRRNLEDITMAYNPRRVKHPLFSAFRTVDAVSYSDIATVPVDRCVLDFATEPTDSFVGLITMDDQDEMYSSARVYEVGRRKPTDDDSDPDDVESDEDEDDDDEGDDDDSILGADLDGDNGEDDDDMSNGDDDSVSEFDDDDGDFVLDGLDLGGGFLEIVTDGEGDGDDSDVLESYSSGDEEDM